MSGNERERDKKRRERETRKSAKKRGELKRKTWRERE